ncbi:MAG: class I SAM-dependent methyltransferase [Pseudomonadota bacterium]
MKKTSHCRACGSTALSPAFSLETATEPSGRRRVFQPRSQAIDYVICDSSRDVQACGLVQKGVTGEETAGHLPSGTHRATRSHLRAIATEALELISGRDCTALDIGCSDGTLLSFYPRWVERVGVDPGDQVNEVGPWATCLQGTFPSANLDAHMGERKFDIITAISVLEEVDEPRAFLARIKSMLAADGVCVLETLYAPITLTQTVLSAVYERKSGLYSLAVLERLLRDCDLKIFKGALSDKDGGSVRLFITHTDVEDYDFDPWYERLARLWDEENALALRSIAPYQAFEQRVLNARESYGEMMEGIKRRGETVHIIGTTAGEIELFNWAGNANTVIEAAISHKEAPADARLGRNGPPIITEAAARAVEPDYFIAPAYLKREMLERWRDSIMRGARMIFVTPDPHEVHSGNYAAEYGKALAGGDSAGGVETLRAILGAASGPRLVVNRAAGASG